MSKETYYDVLGVARDAKLTDINRAYQRHKSNATRDDAAPDPKREALIRTAYETLADEEKRSAYDASLVEPVQRKPLPIRGMAIGAAGVAIAALGLWLLLKPASKTAVVARSSEEILDGAMLSVGRVQAIDMSGQATPAGLAFAIGENVMVGTCQGVTPTTQLQVDILGRQVPARIGTLDEELGLCRIIARGVGGKPLDTSRTEPKTGDVVYAANLNAGGKLALMKSQVKGVAVEGRRKTIEAAASAATGAPLFDTQGLVLGVSRAEGKYVAVPAAWVADAKDPSKDEKFATPSSPAPEPEKK